jgi:hypothetical protein
MLMIKNFIKERSASLGMVILILLLTMMLQSLISYSLNFGSLRVSTPDLLPKAYVYGWLGLRGIFALIMLILWLLKRKEFLFQIIIVTNGLLTLGLVLNLISLFTVLFGVSYSEVTALLAGVFIMAITNILIFSIWYWIIDPPGVSDIPRPEEKWDFLFPQRAGEIPQYENWVPRYTDYIYLAFTTSFAFSPTDTLPLTRRAKLLMLLQSTVSIITLTGIAGSALGILSGGGGNSGGG